jgi:hypothetical protein
MDKERKYKFRAGQELFDRQIKKPTKSSPMISSQQVAAFRAANPCLTLVQVGHHFGISRQRIGQICVRAGVETANIRWGKHLKQTCPLCKGYKSGGSILCSKCYHSQHMVTLLCSCGCGESFPRTQSDLLSGIRIRDQSLFFKDKAHQGKWLAKFSKGRPRGSKGTSRFNLSGILLRYSQGVKYEDICKEFGISMGYIGLILKGHTDRKAAGHKINVEQSKGALLRYSQGVKYKDIVKEFGISQSKVCQILRGHTNRNTKRGEKGCS